MSNEAEHERLIGDALGALDDALMALRNCRAYYETEEADVWEYMAANAAEARGLQVLNIAARLGLTPEPTKEGTR